MADNEIVDFKYDSSKSFLDSVSVLRRSLRSDRSRPDLYLRFQNLKKTQTLTLHTRRDDFYVCKFQIDRGTIWYLEDGDHKDHLGIGLDYAKLAKGIGAVQVGLVRFRFAIDEIIRSFSSDGSKRRDPFHKDIVGKALASLIVMAIETSRDEWFLSEMYLLFTSNKNRTRKLVPAEESLIQGWDKASTASLQGLANDQAIVCMSA